MNAAPRRRWFRFSLRTMFVGLTIAGCLLGGWMVWDYIPGTIRHTENGFPRGTGTLRYLYPNGSIKVQEEYRNGLLIQSTWRRPDGSILASSEFDVKRGGDGYYLRDDGSIASKFHYKYQRDEYGQLYVADGVAVFYKSDGTFDHEANYRDGQEVK